MEEKPKERANLIITCMDRRLNEALELRERDEMANTGMPTIVLRNAGGDVSNLKDSIREAFSHYDIKEARVAVHNDCGAMKDIANRKQGKAEKDQERDMTAMKYVAKNPEDLCKENLAVQQKTLTELVASLSPSTKVIADSLDVLHMPQANGERKAAIILDSTERLHTNYSELASVLHTDTNNVYVIQYMGMDNLLSDISFVPKVLGVKDITIFSTEKTRTKATELFEAINRQAFAPEINLKMMELVQQPATQQRRIKLKG